MKIIPGRYIAALRHLLIQNAIAVQENGAEIAREVFGCGVGHGVIIAMDMQALPGLAERQGECPRIKFARIQYLDGVLY
jgi:hypothetical protein